MARANDPVAAALREYADLVLITGGDAFRVRTYERAAKAVGGHHEDVADLDAKGLQAIPGVGASTAKKVLEFLDTGRIAAAEELRERIPDGVRALTAIPGLGPKRALALYDELGVSSPAELRQALDDEKLRDLKGFGPRSEENLRRGLDLLADAGRRVTADVALGVAQEVVTAIEAVDGCERCAYAGSLRRGKETVGDVDVLAVARESAPLMAAFVALPSVVDVLGSGDTKTSVRTAAGLQVDLRVVPPEAWGAALQYFTGSKEHNVRVRERAVRQRLKLSEYGLFDTESGELVVSRTEEEVYARLGLPWIPPTLREDGGEIEAAVRGELPDLVTAADLRGDLHTHTNLTDGVASLAEMVAEAVRLGREYHLVTDHAPDLVMQRMTDEKILAQREEVRALDASGPGVRVLHGAELNIGSDGSVDWDEDFLAGFDLCVASIHSHFAQPREETTRRLVRACENPYVHVLGHPTARRIGRRPPVDADWDAVFEAAARTHTILEINASAHRLDLPDELVRRAKRHGVRFSIDTDAHSIPDLGTTRYGIALAQRAWLTGADVVNTWPLADVLAYARDGVVPGT